MIMPMPPEAPDGPDDDSTPDPNIPTGPYPSGQATGVSNTLWRPSSQYEAQYGPTTKAAADYGFYAEQRRVVFGQRDS